MGTRLEQDKPLLLLVDDMPDNIHVLAAALKSHYRIKAATSGIHAQSILEVRDDQPELVILDVQMPGMSGIQLLRHIRDTPATLDLPVIMITADPDEQNHLDGLTLDADDFLIRPVAPAILKLRVHNLIRRHQDQIRLKIASHVFQSSGEGIVIADQHHIVTNVNPAYLRMTGFDKSEVLGLPSPVSPASNPELAHHSIHQQLETTGYWTGELEGQRKDGSAFPMMVTLGAVFNEGGDPAFYITNHVDISAIKEAQRQIEFIAHHDSLTKLPNRFHLQVYLDQALPIARRIGEQLAIIFLDLDRFKHINDSLGHAIGDLLLIEVAAVIRRCIRESDLVARLGGDEFVIALRGHDLYPAAASIADKFRRQMSQPFLIAGHELYTTASLGIAIYPDNADSIDTLMQHADTAMYSAKANGGNQFCFFAQDMNRFAQEILLLENRLHQAIVHHQLQLYYQPQFSLITGQLVGLEALLRWHDPLRGIILPDVFIPLAESSHLMTEIGLWALEQACQQAADWLKQGYDFGHMSVNVSPKQFAQMDILASVRHTLEQTGLPADRLKLEITETAVMNAPTEARHILHELRRLGVHIALDDFGTGYSSLAQLQHLPIDCLKIDKVFLYGIGQPSNGKEKTGVIAKAAIALAHALGCEVIAEGVETVAQREFLRHCGCDQAQGYLYAPPCHTNEVVRWLSNAP
ncbi:EAL domain-containing protein [Burkholderiaceae bacterium DAT-1]|nr:EAL domain-containing protein [Burkholderiaceae bacterium DAT-1]